MKKYTVTGMSCAACAARVEKAVSAVNGVSSCSVSLLTNTMGVEGTASDAEIVEAVVNAGYGASLQGSEGKKSDVSPAPLVDRETPILRSRLIASVGFLAVLMYASMGYTMWGWPMPAVLEKNPVAIGILQMLLAAIVMVINQKFFISGFKGLVHRAPNMDTLVALGSMASFLYSVYMLFVMTDAQITSDLGSGAARHYLHEFYFESAAMILTLITVGKLLEAISKGRTTNALKGLMDLAPKTATVLRDGQEAHLPVEQVKKGDIFIVRPGEQIPVDGVVIEGNTAIDESALTGESLPVDKAEGDRVSAGTITKSGFIKCEALRVGEDTTLSQIIKIVSDASATKAPIAKAADKVSGIFVPVVIAISIVTAVVWSLVGKEAGFVLARAISVLVISCPCALGLATPVAIMVGSGVGARKGILFKTAESLEAAGKADIVVLDKTGTITNGEMTVTDLLCSENSSESELISLAVSLEKQSEHPLAAAIVAFGERRGAEISSVSGFEAVSGKGVEGLVDGVAACGGNLGFVGGRCSVPEEARTQAELLAEQGKTPMYFAKDGRFIGVIAVADTVKDDSPLAIQELKSMGLRVVMLTGDNVRTAKAIGTLAGVDEVIAGVLPDGKADVVAELKKSGKVVMVGDGINDAPALAVADIGIAIGAGTDIAIDAADIVLMKSRLSDLPAAIKLSRAALRNIHQNLFWAFFYNAIGIPLAAGVWIPLFNWQLNPMFGALAMSLSSFCVVTNALRLNFVNLSKPMKINNKSNKTTAELVVVSAEKEGEKTMTKTMKIEGMMCPHCSGRVKKSLEALDAVVSAEVSHENGTALVTLSGELANDVLKATVEDAGYTVISVE